MCNSDSLVGDVWTTSEMEAAEKNSAMVKSVVYLWDVEQAEQLMDGVMLAALENKPVVAESHITFDGMKNSVIIYLCAIAWIHENNSSQNYFHVFM